MTNESIANDGRMVPAALDLPPGKLFFGFTYKPYDPKAATVKKVEPEDGAGVSSAETRLELPKIDDISNSNRLRHGRLSWVREQLYPAETPDHPPTMPVPLQPPTCHK